MRGKAREKTSVKQRRKEGLVFVVVFA